MSLHPKIILSIEPAWTLIKENLEIIFHPGHSEKTFSAMEVYRNVYELCCAQPKNHTNSLYSNVLAFLLEKVSRVRAELIDSSKNSSLSPSSILLLYTKAWSMFYYALRLTDALFVYLNRLILLKNKKKLNANFVAQVGFNSDTPNSESGEPQQKDTQTLPIQMLGYELWIKSLLLYIKDNLNNSLVEEILNVVHSDRLLVIQASSCSASNLLFNPQALSTIIDMSAIVNDAIKSYIQCCEWSSKPLDFYLNELEEPLIKVSKDFYEQQSQILLENNSFSVYIQKVEEILNYELKVCTHYFHSTTHKRILGIIERYFIINQIPKIQVEFINLLTVFNIRDLGKLYNLSSNVQDGIKYLSKAFEEHLTSIGKATVDSCSFAHFKDQKNLLDSLLDMHNKYSELISKTFCKDFELEDVLDKVFRIILSEIDSKKEPISDSFGAKFSCNSSLLMVKYFDYLFKKNSLNEGDNKKKLEELFVLFKYLDNKDLFEKYYSKFLAYRLLYSSEFKEELETGAISKLKTLCGLEYVSKLQKMLTDTSLSKDLSTRFKTRASSSASKAVVDFSAVVMTYGSWPFKTPNEKDPVLLVPSQVSQASLNFQNSYQNNFSGRKLTWLQYLSLIELKLNGFDKSYTLGVNYYQFLILTQLNSFQSLSILELQKKTSIPMSDLKPILKTFLEIKLLNLFSNREPIDTEKLNNIDFETKDLNQHHQELLVQVNEKFTYAKVKIKIFSIIQINYPQENAIIKKSMDEDRKFFYEALIIRIMKSNKELTHDQLIQKILEEVANNYKDSLSSMDVIKACINSLVDKSYLKKHSEEPLSYLYLA